jgi:hypothetical protein
MLPIDIIEEYLLAAVSAAHSMVDDAGVFEPQCARHRARLCLDKAGSQLRNEPIYGLTLSLSACGIVPISARGRDGGGVYTCRDHEH